LKLSAEQAHCLFIVAGVASSYKHVHELRHRLSPGSVEGVDVAVVAAEFDVSPCSLWRLNVQDIEWRYRNAMISSL